MRNLMAAVLLGSVGAVSAVNAGVVGVARNGSDVGLDVNIVNSTTISSGVNNTILLCGESSSASSNSDTRPYIPFTLSASDKNAIASGATVTFTVYVVGSAYFSNSGIDLYGIGGKGATTAAALADYNNGVLIKTDFIRGAITTNKAFTVDVTDFVMNQIANNSAVAFRLQMNPTPDAGNPLINVSINSADATNTDVRPVLTITPVPEAASASVLGLSASALLLVRRK